MNETTQQIIEQYGRPAWEAAQRQVAIDAITHVIFAIILLVLMIAGALRIRHALKRPSWTGNGPVDKVMSDGWAFLGAVVVFIALFFLPFMAYALATYAMNPEWMTIQKLLP